MSEGVKITVDDTYAAPPPSPALLCLRQSTVKYMLSSD